jgi:dolichol-phosphate mannosyltransferase
MTPATGTSGPSRSGSRGPAEAERRPSFAVVIPMFNEEAGAERCVRMVRAVLATLPQRTSLIVVNDGSDDGTGAILAALGREDPVLDLVAHQDNQGYGAALRSGVRRAADRSFEYVLFMDSDLTNDPADVPRFALLMNRGLDVIKASRYSPGGAVTGVPWRRVLISRMGNAVSRRLFRLPIRDCTNGFRAVRTELLTRMQLQERRFPIIMEELYWCRWLARSFGELPVTLTNRGAEQRPTFFVYRPGVLYRYLKYPVRAFLGWPPVRGMARVAPLETLREDLS